jgi:hypothetical protein
MIPPRDQLPPEAALLSDAEIERIYSLPPLTDEQAQTIRRLLGFNRRSRTISLDNA